MPLQYCVLIWLGLLAATWGTIYGAYGLTTGDWNPLD